MTELKQILRDPKIAIAFRVKEGLLSALVLVDLLDDQLLQALVDWARSEASRDPKARSSQLYEAFAAYVEGEKTDRASGGLYGGPLGRPVGAMKNYKTERGAQIALNKLARAYQEAREARSHRAYEGEFEEAEKAREEMFRLEREMQDLAKACEAEGWSVSNDLLTWMQSSTRVLAAANVD